MTPSTMDFVSIHITCDSQEFKRDRTTLRLVAHNKPAQYRHLKKSTDARLALLKQTSPVYV